ncbi:hypothetical protein CVT25_011958, partial [Psilocybe cyanescens]
MSGIDFIIRDVASIDEVTEEAFTVLGHEGLIQPARGHACAECSQPYQATSDVISTPNDPSAVLGVDPVVASTVVQSGYNNPAAQNSVQMQNVTMRVIDGMVNGTKYCAYDSCTSDLANYRGGAFCQMHEHEFGNRCHVRDCTDTSIPSTMACEAHQSVWNKYKLDHSAEGLSGSKRMLNRQQENLEWNPKHEREYQPHDQPPAELKKIKHYFGPATFYCVETICFPCGVVEAWAKFARLESDPNILAFINK